MNKFTKAIALGAMGVLSCTTLAACGGPEILWDANLAEGNNNVFGLYGEVVDNTDGSITLKPEGKGEMQAFAFANGARIQKGAKFI